LALRSEAKVILVCAMQRARALLALLLAGLWCSAAWHVDLEALGMLFDHDHPADHHHAAHPAPPGDHAEHYEVVARHVAKDQIRVGAELGSAAVVFLLPAVAAVRPSPAGWIAAKRPRTSDPPLARQWRFVQRCAPDSAAPPVLS
jgi:hypothetical protein